MGKSPNKASAGHSGTWQTLEYWSVRLLVGLIGVLPRTAARSVGAVIGSLAYKTLGGLKRTGRQNLRLAFPEKSEGDREQILRAMFEHLGVQLGEFCKMPGYKRENTSSFMRYEGFDHYLSARDKGRGVLILTGHLGAWELSSFFHSLQGHPMSLVIRRLDNLRVDTFVNGIRCMHGNRVLHKDDFARSLLTAMRNGETIGILMDTNMTPPQGVFVPFFGVNACTASGLARVAARSGAAVLPGFLLWEESERRYVLHFGKEVELAVTGDETRDVIENTALFTGIIEDYVRRYPEQWLWVHRRWKTRPEGEGKLYV